MNKGTNKIKAISRRALEIREKAGFTTETIVKKRYRMAYVPDAIKQAAKELKTPGTAKRTKRVVKTKSIAKPKVTEAKKTTSSKIEPFKKGDYVKIIGLQYAVTQRTSINPFDGKYGIVQNYQRNDVDVTVYTNDGKSTAGFWESNLQKVTKSEFEASQKKRTKRVLNTRAITKKATTAQVGAPLVMKAERARIINKKFIRVSSKGATFKKTYGISAVELLSKSQLDKNKFFSLTFLYEILTKRKSDSINTIEFYGKLIEELAKNGKSLSGKAKKGVNVEGYQFGLIEKMPSKVKPGMFGLQNIAVYDKINTERSGVYVDDGWLAATDAHKLVIIKDVEDKTKKYNHQIIGIHRQNLNQIINGNYPKYRSVMPRMEDQTEVTGWITIDDILPQINGNAIIFKSVDYVAAWMILYVKGRKIGVHAENLMHTLNAFKCNGAKKVKIGIRDETRAILIHADNENTGLVMPMLVNDLESKEEFTVKPLKIN